MPGRTLTRIIVVISGMHVPSLLFVVSRMFIIFLFLHLFLDGSRDLEAGLVLVEELSHFLALGSSVHTLVRLHIWTPCELTYSSSSVYTCLLVSGVICHISCLSL